MRRGKYFILISFMVVLSEAFGQYVPNSSQMFQFASGFNPAFTGAEAYGDLKLGYRYQWAGFGADAPKFINAAYNVRLKQPVDLATHAPRMSNASEISSNAFVPARKRTIHGLGVNIYHETYGAVNTRTGGAVNYGFHYPLSSKLRLSIGVSAAIDNISIDDSKFYFGRDGVPETFDGLKHTDVTVRGGFLLYSSKFYLGVSYLPIFTQVLKNSDQSFSDPFYRGTVQTGVSLDIGPGFMLRPSILALMAVDNSLSMDYSVKAYVQEKVWFGVTYRDIQSAVALLGFNVNPLFGASYSYEMSVGDMKKFNDGSHELVLSFRFNNFKRQGSAIW
jgi:type IX secretion system PorP/SprF family membrane protein